jgi:hypothetical protein
MGTSTPLIRSVTTPAYMRVLIEASDGNRYEADLSSFAGVYCFPRDTSEWYRVSVDSSGRSLVWANHFEVHADQVIALATRTEPARSAPAAPDASA